MQTITITGLDRVRDPKPSQNGHSILAYFSADVGVFSIKGCCLVRTARQGIAAWLPRLDDPKGHSRRSITLTDEPTRNALLKAAREMYIRMGGTEAEWRSRDDEDDLHPYRGCDVKGWPTHPKHPNYRPPAADADDERKGLQTFLDGSIG